MTGGTWAEAVAEFASATGTDGCIQLQTGSVNGGFITTRQHACNIDFGTDAAH